MRDDCIEYLRHIYGDGFGPYNTVRLLAYDLWEYRLAHEMQHVPADHSDEAAVADWLTAERALGC